MKLAKQEVKEIIKQNRLPHGKNAAIQDYRDVIDVFAKDWIEQNEKIEEMREQRCLDIQRIRSQNIIINKGEQDNESM